MRQSTSQLAVALAAVAGVSAGVHESWPAAPKGWSVVSEAPTAANAPVTFSIALTMQNTDQLESMLLERSTPGSDKYSQWLTQEEVASTFAPSAAAVKAVTGWLESSGVAKYNVNGAWIDFVAEVPAANDLLKAQYKVFSKDGVNKLRTLSYSIPDEIQQHVALVDPGTFLGSTKAFHPTSYEKKAAPAVEATKTTRNSNAPSKRAISPACSTSITPKCLKELYNVGCYKASNSSGARVGFGNWLNQSALYSDLFQYEDLNGIPRQSFDVELIAGGVNDQDPATAGIGEANLDVQNIIGVSGPLPVVAYITGGSPPFVPNIDQPTEADNFNEPYVPFYRYLLDKDDKDLPQVISNSYGDEEDSVPYNYAVLTCNLIGMMGLRGITILESSGDLGVGAGCLAPDYKTVEFNAIFPATCPYITSVGGTVAVAPEIAWDGSSGGFSNYFKRPSYQDAAIKKYLADHVSADTYKYYGQYTNWSGRAFPDVAAHSVHPNYQIVYNGKPGPSGGTSAAAPVWAGIVGLLNDARFRAGLPSLGWLNPLIYAYGPKVLTDITDGYAIGCNGGNTQSGQPEPAGSGIVPGARWNATTGWDPTTGYGTPDFQKLKKLVLGDFDI